MKPEKQKPSRQRIRMHLKSYLQELKKHPIDANRWHYLAHELQNLGLTKPAARAFSRYQRYNPSSQCSIHQLGHLLVDLGHRDRAIRAFQQVINLDSRNFCSWYNLGDLLNKRGQYDKAIEAFKRALELEPEDGDVWFDLALAYDYMGALELAREHYQRALSHKPEIVVAHYNLALIHDHFDETEQMLAAYQRALDLNPEYESALYNLGVYYSKQGQIDLATEYYEQAVRSMPESEAWHNLALQYKKAGKLDEALAAHLKELWYRPSNTLNLCNMAEVYAERKEPELAMQAFQQAIQLEPKNKMVWENLGDYYHSCNLIDEAQSAYARALSNAQTDATLHNNISWFYLCSGNFSQALALAQQAERLKPSPWHKLHMAHAYLFLDQVNEALTLYRQIIADSPIEVSSAESNHAYLKKDIELLQQAGREHPVFRELFELLSVSEN